MNTTPTPPSRRSISFVELTFAIAILSIVVGGITYMATANTAQVASQDAAGGNARHP
jgi:hypothetical protein